MTIALGMSLIILLTVILVQSRLHKVRSKQLQQIQSDLQRISKGRTRENLLMFTADRELRSLLVEINELLDRNGQTLSDYAKMELSMKKMISNISHDLKTPLTVVLGYIETLHLGPDMPSEERARLLDKVHGKTIEALGLIHEFFDLAKLESGDKDIPMTRILMNERCSTSILEYYDILTHKDFEVHIDIPDRPIYAFGNEEALHRILGNLLSNAIQYGSDGKTLGLTLKEDETTVYVEVWDKGKGISETHIDHVFERLYTLEDSRNKSYQGSGLGLTITKRLVQSMGGSIHLRSKPYELTVFQVQLKKIQY